MSFLRREEGLVRYLRIQLKLQRALLDHSPGHHPEERKA